MIVVMTVLIGLHHPIKSTCYFISNIIGTAVGGKCFISKRHEPISFLFCGCSCWSASSWWLTYMSVVIWNVQCAYQTFPDWVSIAVFVLPYFQVVIFPFRVYALGPKYLSLLEASLQLCCRDAAQHFSLTP